ncbi:hypothetical protein PanWU01x14_116370 [Parasponia andersonii]|uniref:Uncharacterized protein n=1 Tax=Parasponia andersonii TaxID=3476 RepID=A0A2P5CWQ1_PARAD|nr:hypothetical protein PanWU01x14_116370 [Parasponia andersonii]
MKNKTTVASMWLKLESLYMTESLTNRIYLKVKFFGFKIGEDKSLDENLDDFNKLVIDLENIGKKIDDENQAAVLLNSMPSVCSQLKDTIRYSRETLILEELEPAIRSKEKELRAEAENEEGSEALNIRGRPQTRDNKNQNKAKSKSRHKKNALFATKRDTSKKKTTQIEKENKTGKKSIMEMRM